MVLSWLESQLSAWVAITNLNSFASCGNSKRLRLGDQNSRHSVIHGLGGLFFLIQCGSVEQFEINRRVRQQRHGVVEHLHPDNGLAIWLLDRFETATATLNV